MPPWFTIPFKGQTYTVALKPELAIGEYVPWCIQVDGSWYQLTNDATFVEDEARRYAHYTLRNVVGRTPAFFASRRYPLLFVVDDVAVRAWPQYVARGTGAKTFVHPTLNRRVGTERGPVWLFESAGRPATEGGIMTAKQTREDLVALGRIWLRDGAHRDESKRPAE